MSFTYTFNFEVVKVISTFFISFAFLIHLKKKEALVYEGVNGDGKKI